MINYQASVQAAVQLYQKLSLNPVETAMAPSSAFNDTPTATVQLPFREYDLNFTTFRGSAEKSAL